jgi:CHAD domain-containing protein
MKRRLRRIRRAAGDARDLDVLADRLARDYGELAAPVIELIANERAEVQPAIVRVADRCRTDDRLVRETAKLLHSIRRPRQRDESEPALLRDWARQQFSKVTDRFAAAMPNESSTTAELHEFRIRAKALRYAIELVAPAFGPELRRELYPLVEELQERLGSVQDHVAAIDRCRGWMAKTRHATLQETLRELADAEQRGLTDALREYRDWWNDERVAQVCILLESPAGAPCFDTSPAATPVESREGETDEVSHRI